MAMEGHNAENSIAGEVVGEDHANLLCLRVFGDVWPHLKVDDYAPANRLAVDPVTLSHIAHVVGVEEPSLVPKTPPPLQV
jgi:hypothetical protein